MKTTQLTVTGCKTWLVGQFYGLQAEKKIRATPALYSRPILPRSPCEKIK